MKTKRVIEHVHGIFNRFEIAVMEVATYVSSENESNLYSRWNFGKSKWADYETAHMLVRENLLPLVIYDEFGAAQTSDPVFRQLQLSLIDIWNHVQDTNMWYDLYILGDRVTSLQILEGDYVIYDYKVKTNDTTPGQRPGRKVVTL